MKKDNLITFIKKSKIPIFIISFFILLSFGERLFSNAYSIDTEYYIANYIENFNWWNSLGRWGLVLVNKLFLVGPLVIYHSNLLMILFILLGSILFNYLFYLYIDKKQEDTFLKYQYIFPIVFYTNPIFAEQFNFTSQALAVSLGIAMVALALILFHFSMKEKNKTKKILYNIVGIVITTITFGIYQSIILLYIATVAILYLLKCLNEKDNNFKFLLTNMIQFGICAIIYFAIGKLLGSGNSYLQTGYNLGISKALNNIYLVIISTLKCETIYYNIGLPIAFILTAIIFVILVKNRRINIGAILGGIGVVLAPYYLMIITGVDQLKRTQFNYSFIVGFILLFFILIIMNSKRGKKIGYIILILGIIIAYKQSVTTATLFASDHVRFQHDIRVAEKIMNKLEAKDWYDSNKNYKIIFVGKYPVKENLLYQQGEVIGKSYFEFDYPYYYGPSQRANQLLKTLGYEFLEPTKEEFESAKKYLKENDIKSMPSQESIIKWKEDTIVIRLSEKLD